MISPRVFVRTVAFLLLMANLTVSAEGFRTPAADIAQLVTAPAPAEPLVHAGSGQLALLQYDKVIDMDRLMTGRLGLAGMRLDPVTRITGIDPLVRRVQLLALADTGKPAVSWLAPANSRFAFVAFSPDGRHLSALQIETGKPPQLWLFDTQTGQAKALSEQVNPAWGDPCQWQDNATLVCQLVSGQTAPAPVSAALPVMVEHQGNPLTTRTYAHLLETPADDSRFEFYFSSQLARIDLTGKVTPLPVPAGVINRIKMAPDGDYLLLRRIAKPFPRLTSGKRFPASVEVWRLADGKRLYQSEPMGFGVETDDDTAGDPASLEWGPQKPATAGFIYETKSADGRDEYQWRSLQAPFTQAPTIVTRSSRPIRQFGWTSAGTPWFTRASSIRGQKPPIHVILDAGEKILWQDTGSEDSEPGKALRAAGAGSPVLEIDGSIFVVGNGLTDDSIRPFADRIELATGNSRRLFSAGDGVYEQVLALLDPETETLLTRREGETLAPRYFKVQQGRASLVYSEPDPYPQLNQVERRQISYARADGVTLSATLYLPKKRGKKPLPTLVWIYPREYTSNRAAELPDIKPYRFHNLKGPSPVLAALAGYAVVVNPTMPIISEKLSDNEEYLPQLVSSARAVVDYLVRQGISDRQRMAIGGRSYGAFSTANLLIHTDLFAAGIAMSGAYNRTLTPFGFQHEKRTFWDATDYYASISPFFFANKMHKPLLLIHGGADSNPGTPKIQARRFFHALVGEGATTRYVELAGEEHQYSGRDNVLHATWEMIDWLDRYLKPAG